jgi:hypothetical protein
VQQQQLTDFNMVPNDRTLKSLASTLALNCSPRPMPSPKYRVRLQRGRQQQPAHKNEGRGALDAAAAMRSNGPENLVAFAAARVKFTA